MVLFQNKWNFYYLLKKKTEIEDSDEDDDEITKKKIDAKKIVKNFDKKKN